MQVVAHSYLQLNDFVAQPKNLAFDCDRSQSMFGTGFTLRPMAALARFEYLQNLFCSFAFD